MTANQSDSQRDIWFAGDGQARAKCRAIAWDRTSLGPIEHWPACMRSAVRLCLDSLTPMACWLGPELVLVCNDAHPDFPPVRGLQRPDTLGSAMHEAHPEWLSTLGAQCQQVLDTGRALRAVHARFELSLTPIREDDGRVSGVLQLITAHSDEAVPREGERRQAFLATLSDCLRPLADPIEIQYQAARLLGRHVGASRVGYAEDLGDGETLMITRDYTDGVPSLSGVFRYADYGPALLRELRAGVTSVRSDIAHDPSLTVSEQQAHAVVQVGAMVNVPLVKGGRLVAVLYVHYRHAHQCSEDDLALFDEVAQRVWAAVERAHAQAALDASEQKLRESDAQYRTLFESIDEGFCIIEMVFDGDQPVDYRFIEVNPAFERQSGLAGAAGQLARTLVPDLEQHWFQIYGRVARSGEPVRFQDRAAALDSIYDVYAFRIGTPERPLVAVLFNDISEQKRVEQQLRDSDRRKNDFLAMLGHELRNPLAAIRSASELLKLAAPHDPRLQRTHGVLERQTAHMTRLVDGLLEISRVARGKIQLEREVLDVREIAHAILQDRALQIEACKVQLHTEIADAALWVSADPVRLAQVLDNLLGNALKFTPPLGTVQLIVQAEGDEATIRVRDSGVGIRPQMLQRMFEPFEQDIQDMARGPGGLGLGLALAKGLMELHGGGIEAHSAGPGTGAEFVVRLPLAAAPVPVQPQTAARSASGVRDILIVEDNEDAAEMLRALLEASGHSVRVANSGDEALAELRQRSAEVVLCDIGLPGMSGYELVTFIRCDPQLQETWMIALSGYGQPEDRKRSAEAGFDQHLVKPVDLRTLRELLSRDRSAPQT